MCKAIVIAVDDVRQVFAVQDLDWNLYGVFDHLVGPALLAGDVVVGDISRAICNFEHDGGTCIAHWRADPLTRSNALMLVEGAPTAMQTSIFPPYHDGSGRAPSNVARWRRPSAWRAPHGQDGQPAA